MVSIGQSHAAALLEHISATPLEKNPPDALNFMALLNTHTWQAQLSTFMVESKQNDAIGKVSLFVYKLINMPELKDIINTDMVNNGEFNTLCGEFSAIFTKYPLFG